MLLVKKNYYLLALGILLNASADAGLQAMKDNIKMKKHVQYTSAVVINVSAAICSLFLAPLLMRRLGIKKSIILGEIGFAFHTLSHFYPKLWFMVFGAILGGFGRSLVWITSPIYIYILLNEYWPNQQEFNSSVKEEMVRNRWLGQFLAFSRISGVFGNSLSYISIYAGRNYADINNLSLYRNISRCGADFFTGKETSQIVLLQSIPQSKVVVYSLLGFYLGLQICSILIHGFGLSSFSKFKEINRNVLRNTVESTVSHFRSLNGFLLIPFYFYYGLLSSYSNGIFPRAFVSCVLGIQLGNLAEILQRITNILTTTVAARLSYSYETPRLLAFAVVYGLCNYTVQLAFKIDYDLRCVSFVLAAFQGVATAVWLWSIYSFTAVYFKENLLTAYSIANLWSILGSFTGFILTNYVVVRFHIVVLMVSLFLGLIGYVVVEYLRRKKSTPSEERDSLVREATILSNSLRGFESHFE